MGNIRKIFLKDMKRLFANTMSVIITLGLIIVPCIFAWYNVIACWNVFDNTGNLRVAVANTDEGYESDLVPLRVNIGEQVISALRANDQIDWTFTTEDDAIDGAKSGRYYAAVVIPQDFSKDMMTFYLDDATSAQIVYYSNEKKSAIAPKITDKGADSVSYQVNEVFAETLAKIALSLADALSSYADDTGLKERVLILSDHMRTLADDTERTASVLALYGQLASSAQELVKSSTQIMGSAEQSIEDLTAVATQSANNAASVMQELKGGLNTISEALNESSNGFSTLRDTVDQALADATLAGNSVTVLRQSAQTIGDQATHYRDIAHQLETLRASAPSSMQPALDVAIEQALNAANAASNVQGILSGTADQIEAGNTDMTSKREEIAQAIEHAQTDINTLRSEYDTTLRPQLDAAIEKAATLASRLDQSAQDVNDADAKMEGNASMVGEALGGAQDSIATAQNSLNQISEQLRSLAQKIDDAIYSGNTDEVRALLQSDVDTFSQALAAPVGMERIAIYPVENFGSAMAPLYTTLALYIGSLLILVAVRPNVSKRTISRLNHPAPHELFLGRFGVMAFLSLAQSTLMALGNLVFLKVQVAEPILFMICFWGAGLVFTFIIYALVATFANLGKAIAVLLLIVQVTGCGGSFPLQLLPSFIQILSPYLPATHVVNAMREAMMGTYSYEFWLQMGQLLIFVIPAAILGLVLRKPLASFMEWYIHRVESSKLIG